MKIFKILIDILLLIVTILLQSNEITGRLVHEILGIAITFLLIIHIVTNLKWIKNVTKNFKKVNIKTKIMYIISIMAFIVYFGSIIFGILVSEQIFKLKTMSNSKLILAHMIFGKLAIIIMLLHIGINLDIILAKIKSKKIKTIIKILYTILGIIISIYAIYTLTHSFEWITIFNSNSFKTEINLKMNNNENKIIETNKNDFSNETIGNDILEKTSNNLKNEYIEEGNRTSRGFILDNILQKEDIKINMLEETALH